MNNIKILQDDKYYFIQDKNRCYKLIKNFENQSEEDCEKIWSPIVEDLLEYLRVEKYRKYNIIIVNNFRLVENLFNSYFVQNYFKYREHWFKEKREKKQLSLF